MTLSPKERRALQNVATRNVEAYDFYLRGRRFFYQRTRRNMEFAINMFKEAIELDPAYALAYAGIADCYSTLYIHSDPVEENRQNAEEASRTALELDPDLAEAHASRGLALLLSEDFESSEEEFETAIRFNPTLFEAYYFYARACYTQGKYAKSASGSETNQRRIASLACSMKYRPIRLPTPREPLCSITQTRSASSRQSSMKWLPEPSVPR